MKLRKLPLLVMGLFLLFSSQVYAAQDQIVVDGGLGVFGTEGSSLSQVKFGKVGIQEDLWYNLKQRFNTGMWLDDRGGGRKSSGFGGYQVGYEVTNDVLQASIWSGPTLISSPDIALGGYFQFNETLYLGIVDKDRNSIGIAYNHFSSAGIETPNLGNDFIGLEIKFPF